MSRYSPPAICRRVSATLEPAAMTVRVVLSANEHEGTPIIPSRPALLEPPGLLHPVPALPPLLLIFLRRLFGSSGGSSSGSSGGSSWLPFVCLLLTRWHLRLRIARICFFRSCVSCPCLLRRIGRRRCGRGGRPGVVPQWRRRYRSWRHRRSWRLSGRERRRLCHRRKR